MKYLFQASPNCRCPYHPFAQPTALLRCCWPSVVTYQRRGVHTYRDKLVFNPVPSVWVGMWPSSIKYGTMFVKSVC
jgi:hypothetical protein